MVKKLQQSRNDIFRGLNATTYVHMRLMQLKTELQKITEITYLEGKKQPITYRLSYLVFPKEKKKV